MSEALAKPAALARGENKIGGLIVLASSVAGTRHWCMREVAIFCTVGACVSAGSITSITSFATLVGTGVEKPMSR